MFRGNRWEQSISSARGSGVAAAPVLPARSQGRVRARGADLGSAVLGSRGCSQFVVLTQLPSSRACCWEGSSLEPCGWVSGLAQWRWGLSARPCCWGAFRGTSLCCLCNELSSPFEATTTVSVDTASRPVGGTLCFHMVFLWVHYSSTCRT